MQIDKPNLIIEINEKKFIFLVLKYKEDLNLDLIEISDIKSEGIKNGKIMMENGAPA